MGARRERIAGVRRSKTRSLLPILSGSTVNANCQRRCRRAPPPWLLGRPGWATIAAVQLQSWATSATEIRIGADRAAVILRRAKRFAVRNGGRFDVRHD